MREAPVASGVTAVKAYQVEPSLTAASAVAGNCDSLLSRCQAYGWESASNREAAMTPLRRWCICSVDSGMVEVPRKPKSELSPARRFRTRHPMHKVLALRAPPTTPQGRTTLKKDVSGA